MAGKGPPPKDEGARRRRNKEAAFDELPAAGYSGPYPKLPAHYTREVPTSEGPVTRKIKYLAATKRWYDTFAHSPMATRFTDVDWGRLQEIAPLKDRYFRNPDTKLAAELRLQEALLGATVQDRQRMRLRIGAAGDKEQLPKLAEVRRLRAVDPTG